MNAPFTQLDRRTRLSTVLGDDTLFFEKMHGTEALSGDFAWHVQAISDRPDLDLNDLLGTHATVTAECAQGEARYFDGVVSEAQSLGNLENGNRYAFVLRPWFHIAGLRRNQRIFHDLSAPDILSQVFADYGHLGAPLFEMELFDSYPVLEYTVQYGESDADFCRRIMERFGISWHWQHTAGNHTLILTDFAGAHHDVGARPFYGAAGNHASDEEHFRSWTVGARVTTGVVRLTEYNFKAPTASQEVDQSSGAPYQNGNVESFDWPGDYLHAGEGGKMVDRRVQGEAGQSLRTLAGGNTLSLGAGMVVTLEGDKIPGATGEKFVCLKAQHTLRAQSYGSKSKTDDADEDDYLGEYVMLPFEAPFRPERSTPVPRIYGPQTATVVGAGEIDCDEYGRILVRFHWDLNSAISMRCRVSQNWASKGWGGMVIPRIGMEVIVEFLEGDPDKPIVTGCVYNGKNDVPYKLPQHKTRSTFKTDTHQGEGFNELRFEDKAGEEEIFVHAQKDRNSKIENNQTERVNVNKVESVGHDKASEIGNNLLQLVDGNMEVRVGPGNTGKVTPSGADMLTQGIGPVGPRFGKAGSNPGSGTLTVSVEENKVQTIMGFHDEQVTKHKKIVTEKGEYELSAGTYAQIRAADYIELVCGSASLRLESNGTITVNGVKLLTSSSDKTHIKGTVVKIN
ncbi:MAG: type VI secretion system tip protein TssI/VgrG [Pseudomonadota bacterium]